MVRTIFAKSSGSGRAAIAVWRISGPQARNILGRLVSSIPMPRKASYQKVYDDIGEVVDDGIILWFPGPSTATGEDLVELQLHGSEAVSRKLSDLLAGYGAMLAEPGEFTFRALQNGRMGLLQAEGLRDLLEAETELQRIQASLTYQGKSRALSEEWRVHLIRALAVLEASVDFPDEEDIPFEIERQVKPVLEDLLASIDAELTKSDLGRRLREGLTLAIVGPPNVGKSTILNRLLDEERAIVSDTAGTTRDIISTRMDIAGRLVEVLDTAGLRDETADPIEREGINRTRAAIRRADIVVKVSAGTYYIASSEIASDENVIEIVNKTDLEDCLVREGQIGISAKTGDGWGAFLQLLTQKVEQSAALSFFPHERQIALIRAARERIDQCISHLSEEPELIAEDVRAAVVLLDQLTGRITVEDVLGEIFSSFCIGK